MRILGMRIEKFIDTADYDDPETIENERYILYAQDTTDFTNYEITLYTTHGMCYSGWTTASWGHIEFTKTETIPSFTHKPKQPMFIDNLKENLLNHDTDIENFVFECSYDGGDGYYPGGYISVSEHLFEQSIRHKEKRPVWIFYGDSNLGKSFLAHKTKLTVYETDKSPNLPEALTEDIIVVGNKYLFTEGDIKSRLFGEVESILVYFDNYSNTMTIEPQVEFPEFVPDRLVGHVIWFNESKGYGVLEEDSTGRHYNVYSKNIMTVDKSLEAGDKVLFDNPMVQEFFSAIDGATNITLLL